MGQNKKKRETQLKWKIKSRFSSKTMTTASKRLSKSTAKKCELEWTLPLALLQQEMSPCLIEHKTHHRSSGAIPSVKQMTSSITHGAFSTQTSEDAAPHPRSSCL